MTTPSAHSEVSDAAAFRHAIHRLSRRLRKRAEFGLTPSQVSVLMTIDRHRQLRLGELGRLEQIGKSSVTRVVATLEGAGYIDRQVDPEDRRSFLVQITPHGHQVLDAALARQDDYLRRQLDGLDAADREHLSATIPVIERLLDLKA